MLSGFGADTGVVIGATGFRRNPLWATLQGMEWLMALSIFKIAADRGLPSTGLGNNMAVSRKAYDAVGGYRTLG
ncbi:MAG: glycosyl transferase family 2, partial [Leadbetterella sp.]|nr:glycosyl transferase family 2 [Leadbetterella sp.]